jgi:hypothetical protein
MAWLLLRTVQIKATAAQLLTQMASGESIWGSRSKKDRLLKNQLS